MKLKKNSLGIPRILRKNLRQSSGVEIIFQGTYRVQYFIGNGRFAEVYCVQNLVQKAYFAMKIVDFKRIKKTYDQFKANKIIQLLNSQEQLLKQVNSPHVIKLIQSCQNDQCKIFILQLCNQSSLSTYLRSCNWCLKQAEAIAIIKQICLGTCQLHKHNIIHRDLKLENIMKMDGNFKIIDLGFSKKIDDLQNSQNHTIIGSAYTMAPQVALCLPYGYKADIYSIGVIFLKIVVGNMPFDDRTPYDFTKNPSFFKNSSQKPLSAKVVDFLLKTLQNKEQERISWLQLMNHELFNLNLAEAEQNSMHLISQKVNMEVTKISLHIIQQDQPFSEYISQIQVPEQKVKASQQVEKLVLQIKKGEYIMKEILQRIQNAKKRLGIQKKLYYKLMFLLYQRAYLNLKLIRDNSLKGRLQENIISNIFKLQNKAKQKQLFYKGLYKQESESVISKLMGLPWKLFSSSSKQIQNNLLTFLLNGQQDQNFSKEEQVNMVSKCIQEIITSVVFKSLKKRLLAFREIMNIQPSASDFESLVNTIINTY